MSTVVHDPKPIIARLRARGFLERAQQIAGSYDVTIEELCGDERYAAAARAEFWCWIYDRNESWSYPRIGALVGRDHTTVMTVVKGAKVRGTVPAVGQAWRSCA